VYTALAGKASSVHSHAIAEITGLQAALDAKLNSDDLESRIFQFVVDHFKFGDNIGIITNTTTLDVTFNVSTPTGGTIDISAIPEAGGVKAFSTGGAFTEFAKYIQRAAYTAVTFASTIATNVANNFISKFKIAATGNFAVTLASTASDAQLIYYKVKLTGTTSLEMSLPSSVLEDGLPITGNKILLAGAIGSEHIVCLEKDGSFWDLYRKKPIEVGVSAFADLEGNARDNADLNSELDQVLTDAQNYTDNAVDAAVVGLYDDRGNHDASTNLFPSSGGSGTAGAILKGDIWTISVAGTLGGEGVIPGQTVRAKVDSPGTTAGNWAISDSVNSFVLNDSFTSVVLFNKKDSWVAEQIMSADISFTLAGSGHLARPCTRRFTITADGVHKIFFNTSFEFKSGINSGDVLAAGTYRLWMYWDGVSKVDVSLPSGVFTANDTTPPVVSSVSMSNTWAYISTLNYTLSEAGTIFWAAYPSADSLHTKAEIEAGGAGAAAYGSYNSASGTQAIVIEGLAPGTSYKIHYFAKDAVLNESSAALTSTITTMSAINYAALTSLQLILDDAGLATNTDNLYGTVDASNNVTAWKSLAPGPTGRNFAVNGTGVTLASGVNFGGSGSLRCTDRASFKFLHYHASGIASLKFTCYAVIKFADLSDPNYSVMLFGNNGTSSANIGIQLGYADNGSNAENALTMLISNGGNVVHRSFVVGSPDVYNNNVITPNQMLVFCLDFDGSRSVANRITLKINGITQNLSSQSTASSSLNSGNSTYDLELSAGGNAALRNNSVIRTLILQDAVDSGSTQNYFIKELMSKYGL
jgi:hypothetical protein